MVFIIVLNCWVFIIFPKVSLELLKVNLTSGISTLCWCSLLVVHFYYAGIKSRGEQRSTYIGKAKYLMKIIEIEIEKGGKNIVIFTFYSPRWKIACTPTHSRIMDVVQTGRNHFYAAKILRCIPTLHINTKLGLLRHTQEHKCRSFDEQLFCSILVHPASVDSTRVNKMW